MVAAREAVEIMRAQIAPARFSAALRPLHAHQARGWAKMAIEAIRKIIGKITRQ